MKLKEKLVGMQVAAAIVYHPLNRKQWDLLQKLYVEQLRQVDFTFSNMIKEAVYDVEFLSRNEKIRGYGPENFTSFILADEKTFRYAYSEREKELIKILRDYRQTRPYVNSVYIGYENGAFVRSHERARPTRYDPRTRPWYVAAKKRPGEVVKTEPYRSLTTEDINIGIVKAFTGDDGAVKGVIGADITLSGLSSFIAGTDAGEGSYIFIANSAGLIVSHPDKRKWMKNLREIFPGYEPAGDGVAMRIKDGYIIDYISEDRDYTLYAFVPEALIKSQFYPVVMVFVFLFAALTLFIVLFSWVFTGNAVKPLGLLSASLRGAADNPGGIARVEIRKGANDEISEIVNEYNAMALRLKQVFEELKRAIGDNERFLQISSHDLKEVIRMISVYSQMMEKMCAERGGEEKEVAELFGSAVEELKALLLAFADYSRARGMPEKNTIVEPALLVRELAEEMTLGRDDIKIEIQGTLPVFRGVKARIKYVFRTLISNGIKFNEKAVKEIHVRGVQETGETVFCVEDNGIGIGEEYREKIFEFSRKLHSKKDYPGLGMALCFAKEIVQSHGGRMWFESEVEKGSVFCFSIPSAREGG